MNRRSFFSLLAAPVVAPMVPETTEPVIRNNVMYGTQALSSGSNCQAAVFYPIALGPCNADTNATLRKLIHEINQEVKRGSVTLTATEVRR